MHPDRKDRKNTPVVAADDGSAAAAGVHFGRVLYFWAPKSGEKRRYPSRISALGT